MDQSVDAVARFVEKMTKMILHKNTMKRSFKLKIYREQSAKKKHEKFSRKIVGYRHGDQFEFRKLSKIK